MEESVVLVNGSSILEADTVVQYPSYLLKNERQKIVIKKGVVLDAKSAEVMFYLDPLENNDYKVTSVEVMQPRDENTSYRKNKQRIKKDLDQLFEL